MAIFIPDNAVTHFKCSFDISNSDKNDNFPCLQNVRLSIRKYVQDRFNDKNLLDGSFFTGANEKLTKASLRTASNWGKYDPKNPEHWVAELIHKDKENPFRFWSVEIGTTRLDDKVKITIITKYWIKDDYIGENLPIPVSSTPGIVNALLENTKLYCCKGGNPLSNKAIIITEENFNTVVDEIFSQSRLNPIVIARVDIEKNYLIDVESLAKNIAGNANTYFINNLETLEKFNMALPFRYRLGKNLVRIYAYKANSNDLDDHYRHRFFEQKILESKSSKDIEEMLINGISRNFKSFRLNDIFSIQQVFRLRDQEQTQFKIAKLKDNLDPIFVDSVIRDLEDNIKLLKDKINELEEQSLNDSEIIDDARSKIRTLDFELNQQKELHLDLKRNNIEANIVDLIQPLSTLPTNSTEILETIQKLFPNRIAITAQGWKTSKDFEEQSKLLVAEMWEATYILVTGFYNIVFKSNSKNLQADFENQYGLEYSPKEGSETNKDKDLMSLRTDYFDNEEIDISHHIKSRNSRKPKLFRIYFSIDKDNERFIVGVYGEHLATYSSRSRH